jgi:hypothetical protein
MEWDRKLYNDLSYVTFFLFEPGIGMLVFAK